jgi:hypothetical protein
MGNIATETESMEQTGWLARSVPPGRTGILACPSIWLQIIQHCPTSKFQRDRQECPSYLCPIVAVQCSVLDGLAQMRGKAESIPHTEALSALESTVVNQNLGFGWAQRKLPTLARSINQFEILC